MGPFAGSLEQLITPEIASVLPADSIATGALVIVELSTADHYGALRFFTSSDLSHVRRLGMLRTVEAIFVDSMVREYREDFGK